MEKGFVHNCKVATSFARSNSPFYSHPQTQRLATRKRAIPQEDKVLSRKGRVCAQHLAPNFSLHHTTKKILKGVAERFHLPGHCFGNLRLCIVQTNFSTQDREYTGSFVVQKFNKLKPFGMNISCGKLPSTKISNLHANLRKPVSFLSLTTCFIHLASLNFFLFFSFLCSFFFSFV